MTQLGPVTTLDLVLAAPSLVVLGAAALAVTTRHVVHAALWLVVALGLLAVVYLLLGSPMVALVQVLVYVGAIVVLLLFALMLTHAPIGPNRELTGGRGQRWAAALAGLAMSGLLAATLLPAVGSRRIEPDTARAGAAPIGRALFGGWALPFELLSVLLLAALVAALAISRSRREENLSDVTGSTGEN